MADNTLHIACFTLILQQGWLTMVERQLFNILLEAAKAGNYWDELARMTARNVDAPIIIENVISKCQTSGLVTTLEYLKDHYDHRT